MNIDALRSLGPFHQDIYFSDTEKISDYCERYGGGERFAQPELQARRVAKELGGLNDKSILDVGCNAGGFLFGCARLASIRYGLGIDARQLWIDQAQFLKENITDYDTSVLTFETKCIDYLSEIPSKSFDLVHMGGLLYHVADPIALLKEAGRISSCAVHITSAYKKANLVGFCMHIEKKKAQDKFALLGHEGTNAYWHPTKPAVVRDIMSMEGYIYSLITHHKTPEEHWGKRKDIGRFDILVSNQQLNTRKHDADSIEEQG